MTTNKMTALDLAEYLEGWDVIKDNPFSKVIGQKSADRLRRQHEAIVKLREASEWASVALDGVIDLLPKPESTECRNARKDILKALADTEIFK